MTEYTEKPIFVHFFALFVAAVACVFGLGANAGFVLRPAIGQGVESKKSTVEDRKFMVVI